MTDEAQDWDDLPGEFNEYEDDEVLDLRAVAPPRKRIRVSDELIVTLKSPREFGTRDQARLQEIQGRIRKLTRGKLNQQKAAELSALYAAATKMIVVEEDAVEELTENDMEGLALVFTARWIEYLKQLAERSGSAEAVGVLHAMGLGS